MLCTTSQALLARKLAISGQARAFTSLSSSSSSKKIAHALSNQTISASPIAFGSSPFLTKQHRLPQHRTSSSTQFLARPVVMKQHYSTASKSRTPPPSPPPLHPQNLTSDDAASLEESDVPADSKSNKVNIRMPIRACCFSRAFDIATVIKHFGMDNHKAHSFEKDSVIFQLVGSDETNADPSIPAYMTVFEFGSAVFINCSEAAQEKNSKLLRSFGADIVPETKEEFAVLVDSSVNKSSSNRQDCVIVKDLDLHNVLIISAVLARSVALDSYDIRVEKLLREFRSINTELEHELQLNHHKISPFMPKSIESRNLVYIIAHNNKLLTDLLLSVRLLESPEIAWDFARYNQTFVGLSREFEIDQRFEYLQNRMSLVQSNTKFFLELLHSKKSNRQEWLIIYLISAELILGLAPYIYYLFTGHPIIGH